jgi:hypothetical protein
LVQTEIGRVIVTPIHHHLPFVMNYQRGHPVAPRSHYELSTGTPRSPEISLWIINGDTP